MAESEQDTYIDRPNRRKASSKATKAIVAFLLLVSAAIMLIIWLGGKDALEGAIPPRVNTATRTNVSGAGAPVGTARSSWRWRHAPASSIPTASVA